jgi:hypothetical protein
VAWRYDFYLLVLKTIFYSRSFVKYCFHQSKIKVISSRRRVISSIYQHSWKLGKLEIVWKHEYKGPYRLDAIRHCDANFQFSMTFNFTIFLCFSNIRNHLTILAIWPAYLVKFLSVEGFNRFWKLKIRVALPNRVRSVWALTVHD